MGNIFDVQFTDKEEALLSAWCDKCCKECLPQFNIDTKQSENIKNFFMSGKLFYQNEYNSDLLGVEYIPPKYRDKFDTIEWTEDKQKEVADYVSKQVQNLVYEADRTDYFRKTDDRLYNLLGPGNAIELHFRSKDFMVYVDLWITLDKRRAAEITVSVAKTVTIGAKAPW